MASKEERLARRIEHRIVQATMQSFSGPLPPPAMLAQNNDVVPNGAERIMVTADKQQLHRQELEHCVVHRNAVDQRIGLILGFIGMMP